MPTTENIRLQRTRLSHRYDAPSAGAAHWLVVVIGALVVLGGGAAVIVWVL
jgi:hypothetical protein